MTSAEPAQGGRRIGRYTIRQPLARGGMAEIFLAEAADLPGVRRLVVLKRMLPELARDEGYARMFLDEARILAAISHPNVVQIVEAGREGESLYLAMEYVQGPSLGALLEEAAARGAAVPLEAALHVISSLLVGLHHVHEMRDEAAAPLHLIHRDVSPRNVLLSWDGAVKLIDFGIARAANRMGVTRDGRVRGTVPYMSPEQCRGHHLDRRTDLYSVGILLWELTVGQRLYDGESDFAIYEQITRGEARRPGAARPGYPAELEAVVLRALSRSPADRYATAAEMLDALDHVARALHLRPSARALQAYLREHLPPPASSPPLRPAAPVTAPTRTAETEGPGAGTAARLQEAGAGRDAPAAPPEDTSAGRDAPAAGPEVPAVPPPSGAPRRARRRRRAILTASGVFLAAILGAGALSYRSLRRAAPLAASSTDPAAPAAGRTEAAASAAPAPPVAAAAAPASAAAPPSPAPAPATEAPAAPVARPAPRPTTGELIVEAVPWCQVSVDGKDRGPTPLIARLPAGPHQVRLHNEQYGIDRATRIVVPAGRSVRRRFDFPAPATPP